MAFDYQSIETEFRRIALQAGAIIMDVYERDGFDIRAKSDASPVTEADEAADAYISTELRRLFPEIALVTEEQAASHQVRATSFIIVDPLDGTKEFIQRRGEFTVNIALVEDGNPTRGVVYAPAKGRMFYTTANGQSVEERAPHDPRPSHRSLTMRQPDLGALVVVASKSHRDQATDDYIARYAVADSRSAGSSLKFCLLAAGEADLYPRLGRTMEWDTAAGHAVLSGAGGKVVDANTLEPLRYGKAGFENPFFVAAHPDIALIQHSA